MSKKSFHISDILSVSTEILVSRDHINGVLNIMSHMTEDVIYSNQIPLAVPAMKPDLLQQFPWLKDIAVPSLSGEAECVAWVASVANVHGEWHEVESAPLAWGKHDVFQDLKNQWPDMPVIVIDADGAA
jgi:hypothetical protein